MFRGAEHDRVLRFVMTYSGRSFSRPSGRHLYVTILDELRKNIDTLSSSGKISHISFYCFTISFAYDMS